MARRARPPRLLADAGLAPRLRGALLLIAAAGLQLSPVRAASTAADVTLANPVLLSAADEPGGLPLARSRDEASGGGAATTEGQGSGFFVSPAGMIVTNGHVVSGCTEVDVSGFGKGRVVGVDPGIDLAVVLLETPAVAIPVVIVPTKPRLGQTVVAIGYPLADLLAHNLTVTTGIVSTEVGLGGDRRQFTMTASIEPGNSGGPVVDLEGRVVGVAVSKMSALTMILTTGSAGSNINFAVSAESLQTFLLPYLGVVEASPQAGPDLSVEEVVSRARLSTVELICRAPVVEGAR